MTNEQKIIEMNDKIIRLNELVGYHNNHDTLMYLVKRISSNVFNLIESKEDPDFDNILEATIKKLDTYYKACKVFTKNLELISIKELSKSINVELMKSNIIDAMMYKLYEDNFKAMSLWVYDSNNKKTAVWFFNDYKPSNDNYTLIGICKGDIL